MYALLESLYPKWTIHHTFILMFFWYTLSVRFLGNRNSRRNIDVEKNKEEEHLPLISQNQLDINESCVEGIGFT